MINNNKDITYQTTYSNQIYLNSEFADIRMNSTMNSNVAFFFTSPLKIEKNAIEMRLSVVNCQIPVSWYQINSSNNKINITIYSNPVITTSYYLTPGNYNSNSFIAQWAIDVGTYFTISFNKNTNCYQFSNLISSFSFSDDINSLFPVIGLLKGTVYGSSTISNNFIMKCLYPVNFGGLTKLHINSNTFTMHNLDSHNKSTNRTIACIPINAMQNSIIFYNNITNYHNIFKSWIISSIDISIVDINKNYIDFQNQNWAITLQIDIVSEVIENLDNLQDVYNTHQEL